MSIDNRTAEIETKDVHLSCTQGDVVFGVLKPPDYYRSNSVKQIQFIIHNVT